jgi:Ni/Co efflux regulator RcnB
MKKTPLICAAALAAMSFAAGAQDWRAQRDFRAQAQQQYQAPQPGSEQYNPELDPSSPVYQPNKVAPGGEYSNDPRRQQYEQQYPQRSQDRRAQAQRDWERRNWEQRRDWERRDHARSYTPRYARGGYAPEWRSERYWVRDWRSRHLSAPPRGYQWVQTDTGDLLLMAIATGLIANVIIAQ